MSNKYFYVDILANWITQDVLKRGTTHHIIVFGEPGAGKSYFAILLAMRLKNQGFNFNLNDIVFSVDEAVIRAQGKRRVIILDESAFSIDKRNFMSQENRIASGLLRMNRMNQNVFIFVAQEYLALDKNVRYFVKSVVHVKQDYYDVSKRYFSVYKFEDFERTRLAPRTYVVNNVSIEFVDKLFPNPADDYGDFIERYEKKKEKRYEDVIGEEVIKYYMKKYNVDRETAEEMFAARAASVAHDLDDVVLKVKKQLTNKYADVVEYIVKHYIEFLKPDDPTKIDVKKIIEKYPEIPRSSAYRIAKEAEARLSDSEETT